MPQITFEHSSWFILLVVLLSGGAAYLMYQRKAPWNALTNWLLMGVRFILFSLLSTLLLNPLINQFVNTIEKPIYVIAIDNSKSITNSMDSLAVNGLLATAQSISDQLVSKDYQVSVHTLSEQGIAIKDVLFEEKITNLNAWLRNIEATYEGKNLAGAYLISDGKYNQGISPAYFPYPFLINTIGVGDTRQKEDVVLQNVLFNKIAYQGNRFPVVAEVINHGLVGQETTIEMRRNGKLVSTKTITFNQDNGLQLVEFEVEAEKSGIQTLQIRIKPLADEAIETNNSRRIYVDVVNGKQRILILASNPNPDVKALAAVIDKNKNYELDIHVPNFNKYKPEKYDLVIVHQPYDRYKRIDKVLADLRKQKVPVLFIMGNGSNVLMASRTESNFSFKQKGASRDLVFSAFNNDFSLFTLSEEAKEAILKYPPISIPYGDLILPSTARALLNQKIGSINTDRPLLYLNESNGEKSAFLLGEGIWKWRMQSYALYENTDSFDELFSKLIQYLCTKVDKRKLKCYPSATEYNENQVVVFRSEIYNDIYERVFNLPIQIVVSDQEAFKETYSFTPSSAYSQLELSNFPPGLYDYRASVEISGEKETVGGRFSVKAMQLERLDQVADHQLLQLVSNSTNGQFYTLADKDAISASISSFDHQSIIHTHEDVFPLINLQWICFLLLTLVTIEWFVRKYNGGY